MSPLISKKFSFFHVVAFSIVVSLFTYGILSVIEAHQKKVADAISNGRYCDYKVKRASGYKFIKPIMWVDEECESDNLVSIKQRLTEMIEQYKQYKGLTTASVYLRSNSEWTVVNEGEKYDPGSLYKVPLLITVLKMDEDKPGFLNKVIPYTQPINVNVDVTYASKAITLGKSYTVKELLTYMIKYSDNLATTLLVQNMDNKTFQKLFMDVGLEVPNLSGGKYLFTAKDYSFFMRTIFNAGYLTTKNSEYAAELLSQSDFKDGIAKGLPAGTKMVHKFGEAGNQTEKQLHESAVVYFDDKSYLLTVMTKGTNMKSLSDLTGDISKAVYETIKNSSGSTYSNSN